nr:uncharacterized protein LOC115494718 isoform X2 [Taeniopygia guttata]
MSSRQRKRPGGAVDSRPARKRSRLLPSSAGGTSQMEPIDLEESGTPAFEPAAGEVIDLTGVSSEPEVITISDDESPVDRQQSQQQPHLSRVSENSAEPLAKNDEEEPGEDDGAWPAGPSGPPVREGDNSQVQDKGQSQQHSLGPSDTENSAELRASDSEEEPSDNDDAWMTCLLSPSTCEDDNAESQQDPLDSRAAENAAEVLADENEEEPQDIERPSASLLCVICMSCYSQLVEVYQQQRRRATLNSQEQVDASANGTGANDAPVADSAPAEQGAAEEGAALSDSVSSSAQQGGVIRCPICMDSYSEVRIHLL